MVRNLHALKKQTKNDHNDEKDLRPVTFCNELRKRKILSVA